MHEQDLTMNERELLDRFRVRCLSQAESAHRPGCRTATIRREVRCNAEANGDYRSTHECGQACSARFCARILLCLRQSGTAQMGRNARSRIDARPPSVCGRKTNAS